MWVPSAVSVRVVVGLVVLALGCAGPFCASGLGRNSDGFGAPRRSIGRRTRSDGADLRGFLKPEWSEAAYRNAARLWDQPAPDPDRDPAGYAAAFRHRYGLHPAPFPNDGLPMGLRRGIGPDGDEDRPPDRLHGLPRRLDRRHELCRTGQHPARPQGPAQRADDRRRPAPAAVHVHPELVPRDRSTPARSPSSC